MFIQVNCFIRPSPIYFCNRHIQDHTVPRRFPLKVSQLNGVANSRLGRRNNRVKRVAATEEQNSSYIVEKKRKVIDHICLFKSKVDLSGEEEKDMLDYLYTTQYQMGGILSTSLGRISNENPDNYTHAVYMRFQRKEDLTKFYEKPFYLGVLKEHVFPYCHELLNVDYESEVEDDILPLFRKGEEFNYGVEFVLLMSFLDNAIEPIEDALASLGRLIEACPSLIVQYTQGWNFNLSNKEYAYGIVIRFRSSEAFEIFVSSSEYTDIWRSKFEQITKRTLSVHFSVDPVGTEIM